MNERPKDLSGLVASRLCHDLVSPVGAIGNGLELLTMTGLAKTPELALVMDSLENAQARLRFYRVAFGSSRADQSMGSPELAAILHGVYGAGRLTATCDTEGEIGRDSAKLALLLVLCIEASLSHGGQITVTRNGPGWVITGSGKRYRDLGDLWTLLETPQGPSSVSPDRVQFPLAHQHAAHMGLQLCVSQDAAAVKVTTSLR